MVCSLLALLPKKRWEKVAPSLANTQSGSRGIPEGFPYQTTARDDFPAFLSLLSWALVLPCLNFAMELGFFFPFLEGWQSRNCCHWEFLGIVGCFYMVKREQEEAKLLQAFSWCHSQLLLMLRIPMEPLLYPRPIRILPFPGIPFPRVVGPKLCRTRLKQSPAPGIVLVFQELGCIPVPMYPVPR